MLRELYQHLEDSPLTEYQFRGNFVTPKNGERISEQTIDLIIITFSDREILQVGTFSDHTRIGYMGNSKEIEDRIKKLRLRRTPNNLGDVIFHQLQRLAEQKFGPTYVEQKIEPGYESQLKKNLKSLIS